MVPQQTTAPTLANLKAATAGSNDVVDSSGSSGEDAVDDTAQNVVIDNLTTGITYYFYAALESGAESDLSNELSFNISSP